jgi:hypothetical protein
LSDVFCLDLRRYGRILFTKLKRKSNKKKFAYDLKTDAIPDNGYLENPYKRPPSIKIVFDKAPEDMHIVRAGAC